jgi:hypothetical protein
MPNIVITPTVYTRGVLMNLGGYLNIAKNMSTEYTKEFGNKAQKIGATFNVRKPQRFEGTTNIAYTPESLKNIYTPVTVDKTFGVHFEWSTIEKTLSIQDAQEKYFKPAALRIAHYINQQSAQFAFYNTFNTVGTPGVTPGAASATVPELLAVYMGAGDKLVAQGLPENEPLTCIVSRKMSSVFVGKVSSLFTPTELIGGQYKKGWVDPTGLGYRWAKDQGLPVHTSGTFADSSNNTVVAATATLSADDGNNSTQALDISGADSGATYKRGDHFTIAGVYAVHPQYRTSTGELMQFKVLADTAAAGDGTATLSIMPAITPTGQYQNVNKAPAAGDAVLFNENLIGNVDAYTATVSRAGLLLHKNAFAFVSVQQEGPEAGMGSICVNETDPSTGTKLQLIRSYDPVLKREITRLDTLFGFGKLYPEMSCVILSAA